MLELHKPNFLKWEDAPREERIPIVCNFIAVCLEREGILYEVEEIDTNWGPCKFDTIKYTFSAKYYK